MHAAPRSATPAPRHDQGDVVALFPGAEAPHLVEDRGDELVRGQAAMLLQRLDQPFLAELLVSRMRSGSC